MSSPKSSKLSGRGGPGRGQGRKPTGEVARNKHSVSLSITDTKYLKQLGGGNLSEGIRRATLISRSAQSHDQSGAASDADELDPA